MKYKLPKAYRLSKKENTEKKNRKYRVNNGIRNVKGDIMQLTGQRDVIHC